MKQELLRPSQFAKKIGISRQAVFQAIQKEQIPATEKDGKKWIDLNNREIKEYIRSVEDKKEKPVKIKKPVKVKKQKKPKKTKAVAVAKPKLLEKKKQVKDDKQTQLEDLPYDIYEKLNSGESLTNVEIVNMPKVWVEKIKIYESTKQIVQKRKQERRELINKKLIRILLGKLFEIHTNQFLTIKSKAIPDIAGIFGSNDEEKKLKAEKILDDELWKILRNIKYEFDKFLTKAGDEPLD